MKYSRVERLVNMITLLEGSHKKWTASKLAENFGISERTFHRDRIVLEKIGVPLYFDSEKETYDILDTYSFSPPEFTRDEAVALSLAASTYQSENSPYRGELDLALSKILNALPESICEVIENIDKRLITLSNPSVDLTEYQELITAIEKSIEQSSCIEIEYNSLADNKIREREIDPYNLILKDGACYLVGYCHLREDIRTFRIDRIYEYNILDIKYERPENFSADMYFRYSWGVERGSDFKVELVFKGTAARIVQEYDWHPSQQIEMLDDDKILFKVRTGSSMEIKRWILSFGSEVEVKKPDWLCLEIKQELEKMLKQYK
ncbi:MAG: helix-turn-helix transcriptional regulator [Halothermotrichaceae bacterium]